MRYVFISVTVLFSVVGIDEFIFEQNKNDQKQHTTKLNTNKQCLQTNIFDFPIIIAIELHSKNCSTISRFLVSGKICQKSN